MLCAVSEAGIVLCFLPEPAYLMPLELHFVIPSSLQSFQGVLGYQAALLRLQPFSDRELFICIPSSPTFTYLPPFTTKPRWVKSVLLLVPT